MKKFILILACSALLAPAAFASAHQSRGSRDYLPAGYCMKNNCTSHESLSSIQNKQTGANTHTHALKAQKLSNRDLEERRLWERGSRGSVRN